MYTMRLLLFVSIFFTSFATGFAQPRIPNQLWKKHVIQPASKTVGSINGVVAADFDRDGNMDVMSSFGGKVVVFRGPSWKVRNQAHQFGDGKRGACIHCALLDVDRDGDMDFCGSNDTVFWLECPSRPFSEPWNYRTVDDDIKGTHCLTVADIDRDGKQDLIANSFKTSDETTVPNSITWQDIPRDYRNAPHWTRHVLAKNDAPGGNHYMGVGDVDGDGRPDVACGAKGGEGFPGGEWFAWWRQPEDPTRPWTKHLLSDKQPGATNIHPVDLNADGHTDFFATRGHGAGVLWFKGPRFEEIEIDASMQRPHCLVTIDLDKDGDIDAATCGSAEDGVCVWYENDGRGRFRKRIIGKDQSSYDIRAVDLDKDGDLDILIAGHFSRNIVWYENPL